MCVSNQPFFLFIRRLKINHKSLESYAFILRVAAAMNSNVPSIFVTFSLLLSPPFASILSFFLSQRFSPSLHPPVEEMRGAFL